MYIQVKILIFLLILCESQLTISTAQTIDEESNDSIEITANESEDWPNHIGRHLKESYRLKESLSAAIQSLSQDIDDEIDNTDNPLGETNLKSLFVKYDTDDGNTCLLDSIKQDILWWVYPNGTLRTTNARFSTHRYLDLSHGNISKDLDLLFKSKFGGRLNFSKVQAFSAAYNNLNAAPYITLSSMKGSLKYLSLQGNQFSAINADAEAIERFLQDTQIKPNNEMHNKCREELLANGNIDLYDRMCLQLEYNKDTDTPNTQDFIYEDHIRKLQIMHRLFGYSKESIAWAKFPNMPQLLELDVSNCSIEYLTREAFRNVTNLRKLFISNNKIMTLEADTFYHIQGLQYLDLSFTNVLNYNYQFSMPTLEVILNLVYGLKIYQTVFKMLPELVYLDLSHSKITRNSAVAFTHLGSKLKYLSLCYTSFPMVSNGLFKNTALEGLDLSGNSFVSYNIVDDAFDGIGDTLKCLYFEHSNLGDLSWSKPLRNLLVLGLAGNNINALSSDVFESLVSLKVLDLSSNHIGNWYKSVFRNNSSLRVLNLRSNNINMLSTEMLKDFENLEYLSLGDNNFICNCMLREVVEVAANNNKQANCSYEVLEDSARDLLFNRTNWSQLSKLFYKQFERDFWDSRIIPLLTDSYKNIKEFKQLNKIRKLHFVTSDLKTRTCPSSTTKTFNDTSLKFQLLDYEATNYWCFNETDQIQVDQLNCQVRAMADLELQIHNTVMIITAVIGSILGASILGFIIYLKRWHIHYYYASLKSAALLSRASKESLDKFHHLTEHDPNMVYDIFISYCQNDRPWVLEELLPNVEKSGDISICLHERDFQIGVTILDNIISCMDRSRSLMLLISSKFLLSHWCQFEMYLAQHRIFEVSKEHLILVFLEDIPRRKRPKTLQYLMDIKTYIKWPSKAGKQPSTEERKLFWKRLRKSLEYIGIGTKDSKA
ncbi:toll-like receptor 6 isoform X1 [Drosophila albomicans]|uniref:Toll-like receptor 6 isoform X1 n=1 Tax=Drosophila albomicans TaxID=7291 RepID=A0A6P8WVA1_DROAB|nr:toll-like receptor 6 isoform X1 [Drosophila albomicans]